MRGLYRANGLFACRHLFGRLYAFVCGDCGHLAYKSACSPVFVFVFAAKICRKRFRDRGSMACNIAAYRNAFRAYCACRSYLVDYRNAACFSLFYCRMYRRAFLSDFAFSFIPA